MLSLTAFEMKLQTKVVLEFAILILSALVEKDKNFLVQLLYRKKKRKKIMDCGFKCLPS